MSVPVPVWLVERTYSDDEQNIIILKYATEAGDRILRKERAITSFSDRHIPLATHVMADPDDLEEVADPETRSWYRSEVERMRGGQER